MFAVQRLEQIQDFIAGLPVEVSGRFVAQQQCRVRDNAARDADALLFAAGERAGIMLRALRQPDHRQRGLHVFPALGLGKMRQQQRQFHVALRRQHRHQIVKLEDESDMPRTPRGERAVG